MRRRTKNPRTIIPRLIKSRTIRILAGMTKKPKSLEVEAKTRRALDRYGITTNPRVMGGKPRIRGTRVTVETIAGLLATQHSDDEILALYPYVCREDIRAVERWVSERPARTAASSKLTAAERMGAWNENSARGEEALCPQLPLERESGGARGTSAPRRPTFDGRQIHVEVESTEYPMTVKGTIEGLPFALIEEGEDFRFVVSAEPAGDPRSVTSNRDGFLVTGCVGLTRVRGEAAPMSKEQVRSLIESCVVVLLARKRRGRNAGETGRRAGGGRQR
jgi:uncharacterized protein (DUF433 family)